MSTREILVEMVAENPNVTRKAICDRTGVTRERIRQILLTEGLSVPYGRPYPGPWCGTCGNRIDKINISGLCLPCQLAARARVTFICEVCFEPFELLKREVAARSRNGKHPRFCKKTCFGSFAGNNYGFVAHPENSNRGQHWIVKTHCKHGHPFNEENTYVVPGTNNRHCRACDRRRKLESYHRLKEAQS